MLTHFVSLQNALADRLRPESGVTAVEYGLLVALIAAVIIGIVIVVGHQVSDAFNSVSSKLPSGDGGGGGGGCGFFCFP